VYEVVDPDKQLSHKVDMVLEDVQKSRWHSIIDADIQMWND